LVAHFPAMSNAITYEDAPAPAAAHAEHPTSTGIESKKLLMWLFLASDCMFFGTLISTHLVYRQVYPYGAIEKGIVDVTGTFDIELTSFSTFILLMSSFLMALAVSAMHKGQIKSFRRAVVGVMFFGLIFLGCQVFEFTHFFDGHAQYTYSVKIPDGEILTGRYDGVADTSRAKGHLTAALAEEHTDWTLTAFKQTKIERQPLSLQNSIFGSTFFLMTGTHGTHVAIGVLWLASMYFYSFSGRMEKNMHGSAIDVEIAGLYWHFVDIVWIVIFTAVYLVEYIPGYNPPA
jgi:heme/copper-type cytochrome/quinol oxidase subunit 3